MTILKKANWSHGRDSNWVPLEYEIRLTVIKPVRQMIISSLCVCMYVCVYVKGKQIVRLSPTINV
jgi:hypothetical protein